MSCEHNDDVAGMSKKLGSLLKAKVKATTEQEIKGKDVITAETCDQCGTYRKVINQEKDPLAEPLADDLASLTMDLLMSESTRFQRSSANPLLFVAVAEEQAADAEAGLVDPAAQ